jgi:hypothetical protein
MYAMRLKSSGKTARFYKDIKIDRITTCISTAAVRKFAIDFCQFSLIYKIMSGI